MKNVVVMLGYMSLNLPTSLKLITKPMPLSFRSVKESLEHAEQGLGLRTARIEILAPPLVGCTSFP